jgi:uncharacterized membrane protein (DUF441 family)
MLLFSLVLATVMVAGCVALLWRVSRWYACSLLLLGSGLAVGGLSPLAKGHVPVSALDLFSVGAMVLSVSGVIAAWVGHRRLLRLSSQGRI